MALSRVKSHHGIHFEKKLFCAQPKNEIIFVNNTIFSHIFAFLFIFGQLFILKSSRIASLWGGGHHFMKWFHKKKSRMTASLSVKYYIHCCDINGAQNSNFLVLLEFFLHTNLDARRSRRSWQIWGILPRRSKSILQAMVRSGTLVGQVGWLGWVLYHSWHIY